MMRIPLPASTDPVRDSVCRRDGTCLLHPRGRLSRQLMLGICSGSLGVRKMAPDGDYVPSNLVTLCDRHRLWADANREEAVRLGLERR